MISIDGFRKVKREGPTDKTGYEHIDSLTHWSTKTIDLIQYTNKANVLLKKKKKLDDLEN